MIRGCERLIQVRRLASSNGGDADACRQKDEDVVVFEPQPTPSTNTSSRLRRRSRPGPPYRPSVRTPQGAFDAVHTSSLYPSHHELSMCSTEWASACMPQPMQQQQVLDHVLQYSTERNNQSLLPVLRHPRKLALAPYPHPPLRVPLPRKTHNLSIRLERCRDL